jgi:hypothetical protein
MDEPVFSDQDVEDFEVVDGLDGEDGLEGEEGPEVQEDLEVLECEDRSTPIEKPMPGCAVSFHADNKRHHAICLAIMGDELLLEHKGASRCFLFTGKVVEIVQRLRAGVASATIVVGGLKPCQYRTVPKKWLWEMVKSGQTWKGIERGGTLAPTPEELLKGNYQMELF